MTEDEAKTKWCPFAAPIPYKSGLAPKEGQSIVFGDNGAVEHMSQKCIASGCMLWNWDWKYLKDEDRPVVRSTTEGSCGLCGL